MKVSAVLILVAAWLPTASAYQLNPDQKWITKTAIEKSVNKKPSKAKTMTALKSTATLKSSTDFKTALTWYDLYPENPPNYWFNQKIHTFGNTGFFGGLHAALAPLATKLIDLNAYEGTNIRDKVCERLRQRVGKANARVADLCCGVGISTRALQGAFRDAETIIGIDTSPEMIAMAKMLSSESVLDQLSKTAMKLLGNGSTGNPQIIPRYEMANAESTKLPSSSCDLVTIMYGFHEVPFDGRDRILEEARRLLSSGGTLAIVDISPTYTPSPMMLAGEPYVLEYKQNINTQLRSVAGFHDVDYQEAVPGHVSVWLLKKQAAPWGV